MMDKNMNNPIMNDSQKNLNTQAQETHVEEIEDLDLLTTLISELEDDNEISVTINQGSAIGPIVGEEDLGQVDIDATDEEDADDDNSQTDASDNFQVDFL
jgi:hypothetical protein